MNLHIALAVSALLFVAPLSAGNRDSSRWSVSTNAADWLALLTMNTDGQYAISRHCTLELEGRVNRSSWGDAESDREFRMKHNTVSIGARWWPWYTYSGWWFGSKGQYQEYNRGGFSSPLTEMGDAFGIGFSGGYCLMLMPWLNIDFGIGVWGGRTHYTTYSCPTCGKVVDKGDKWFVLPNELRVSAMIVF